jgi:hypothetical protein
MRVDALAVRLRPRTPMEAADLGARLCQSVVRTVYPCYALVALPVMLIALASMEIGSLVPPLILWWAKPWLDRTILFVLSRAAFGQPTTPGDVWRAQRQVWWRGLLVSLTLRRLSPWRSVTEPVYQLEGLSVGASMTRARQIRQRNAGSGLMMTGAFATAEYALSFSLVSLLFWLAPAGQAPDLGTIFAGEAASLAISLALNVTWMAAVLFLEPFYVAAGFAMYLNRRAELEAWDIEQEFRRAFAQ